MALGHLWAGRVYGTNTGDLFVRLGGEDNNLKGTLHFADADTGIVVYEVTGTFDGSRLTLAGSAKIKKEMVEYGNLKATASLRPTGTLDGEWETSIGSAGTFALFPHVGSAIPGPDIAIPDQMHTARHPLGPIQINRDQIIALAEDIQRAFLKSKVIVTFAVGSEQSRLLEDFKQLRFVDERTPYLKIFVREPDGSGIDKLLTVEFGPEVNFALAQSSSESWSLGEREKLKRELQRFERVYLTGNIGEVFNQVLLVSTIVFLPSLPNFWSRAILMGGVWLLTFVVRWLHRRYLPNAVISLGDRKQGWLERALPFAASWLIGIVASGLAATLAAYLNGMLSLTTP